MLIELSEGFFVNPELVAVVKVVDKNKCALFTSGQSAVDGGFTVDYSAEEVAEAVNDACVEAEEDEESGEDGEEAEQKDDAS